MTLILNLDLDNLIKVTDYGFNRKESPLPTIYFRLYKNGYAIDMDTFQRLSLRIRLATHGTIYTKVTTEVVEINGEKLVKFPMTADLLEKMDKLFITPTVRTSNQSTILKEFKLIIYEGSKQEMNAVKHALERFNHLYGLYIKSIKRDQINKPLGVVGLGSNGRFTLDKIPDSLTEHIFDKIRFKTIHGLRLNSKFMLEYYDSDDDEFYEANSIFAGRFDFPNKPITEDTLYNLVFGGYFDDLSQPTTIDAGTFENSSEGVLDGGFFTDDNSSFKTAHGGKF